MKIETVIIALFAILVCAGTSLAATQVQPDSALSETSALQQVGAQIQTEEKSYKADLDNSKWVYEQLKKVDGDIKEDEKKNDSRVASFEREKSAYNNDEENRYARCSRNFQLPREQDAYNQCAADSRAQKSRKSALEVTISDLNKDIHSWNDRWSKYQQTMKDWVNKQTEIRTRRAALNDKERDYKTRLNNLQNSPAYKELLRKAPQSQACSAISAAAVQDFDKLDGDFERAQRCLQGVWDGAK